jgi:predicted porin
MKKTLIVGAVLTGFTAAASAQQTSSVTLYGVADVNMAQSKTFGSAATPSTTVTGMNVYNPTNPRGSRFGLRGSENLGDGLRATFQLEAGLNPENGTTSGNNQLFNRHAWVGLAGGFGELTLGRQETMHRVMNNNNYNDVSTEGELSVTTSNSGLQLMQNFGTRVDNAIRYTSPAISGVRVRVQQAMGHRTTASTNGVLLTYDQGPLRAALAYEYYDGAGVTGLDRWNQVTTVGGQYNLGFATVGLGYQTTDRLLASNAANTLTSAATLPKHKAYNIGVLYPVSKVLSLRVQYTESQTSVPTVAGAKDRTYGRTGISARYTLSPRTFLYAAYTEKAIDLTPGVAAQVTSNATANKNSFGLGISHAF